MHNKTDIIASKFLGKKVEGKDSYDPSFLVAIPRDENRLQYKIDSNNLPFIGWDIWHGYEFSTMTKNNIPITRVIKLKYNCDSDFLIESKSLKLYLNSFNMSNFGDTTEDCLKICKDIIEKDLSEKLCTKVEVNFLDNNSPRADIYSKFENILNYIDEESVKIKHFKETPEVLEIAVRNKAEEKYITFDSLRSNCRVTHQPDFGDVYIYYKSSKHILETSLLEYLTSFRNEYHFHEECCEMIFKRLKDILNDEDDLFVSALYTRRGGIDISPSRWSKNCNIQDVLYLIDTEIFARNGIKQ